jgi:cysteine desulfurase/selenocysteine lyase
VSNEQIIHSYQRMFSGVETEIPLLNGKKRRYVNLDNAASTPPLRVVQEAVNAFLPFYSSVHRGTGFKSQLSTHAYERARLMVMRFVEADHKEHTCIFGKNTTEAINKLAHRFHFDRERNVVLTTGMEHHSNDLPWRSSTRTIHVDLTPEGQLDETGFDKNLELYRDHIALVAITGASNVTGYINPIYRLAEKAHNIGAQIFVDCAQLAPHRKVDMRSLDDPTHIDYISISAHKLYAPFGTGALIGRRDTFEHGDPDQQGGGTIEIVTLDDVVWAKPPDRDEAGSPNTVGAIALAAAVEQLSSIGMEKIAAHEADLTKYALSKMRKVPGIRLYGDLDPDRSADRLGVIPFALDGIPHFKVSAILGYEFGIGVRSGCFCAHPYILHLLHLTPEEAYHVRQQILSGDKTNMPGLIRASFGLYNSIEDIDCLVEALIRIAHGDYKGSYKQDKATGEYKPLGWEPDYESYFSFVPKRF